MQIELILWLVALTVPLVCLVKTVLSLKTTMDAERRFIEILRTKERAPHLRALLNDVMRDGAATATDLQRNTATPSARACTSTRC
jgi:hypothetical protein